MFREQAVHLVCTLNRQCVTASPNSTNRAPRIPAMNAHNRGPAACDLVDDRRTSNSNPL